MTEPRGADWRPTAGLDALRLRARLLRETRRFFDERGALEVDTPALSSATVTDFHLHSLSTRDSSAETLYLQTSPEFAMKRLLAAGSGPIYQICKAFRDGERGDHHNPEFTMLEWYCPGFDHHALMDEVEALLAALLGAPPGVRLSYAEAFRRHAAVDPHLADAAALREAARALGIRLAADLGEGDGSRDAWLALLLTHAVEPKLDPTRPTFLYDFPASQAALARIRPDRPPVAERFEVYLGGLELANGYHELLDAAEQRRRFEADLAARAARGLPAVPVDRHLLAALEAGLPPCAGVALGFDRLVMVAAGASALAEVVAFPIDRA